jgi:hypothetical protein
VRSIELRPEEFPLVIKLKLGKETKEYVLIKTRQDKLLLNKPTEVSLVPKK